MSCENNHIDERGAKVNITVRSGNNISRSATFVDADDNAIDMTIYSEITFTASTESYTLTGGDISVSSNVITLDFTVSLDAGNYDYTMTGTTATGEHGLLYGKLKVV